MSLAAESTPRFYGYLRYDAETFTQLGGPRGLYCIDAVPEAHVKAVDLNVSAVGGGCYGDGKYYAVDYAQNQYGELTSVTLKIYENENWSLVSEKEIPQTSIPTTMTYNPVDNKIYGCFFNNNSDKMEFGVLDKEDGSTTVFKVLDVSISAMACDHEGTVYVIDELGDLSRYDAGAGDFVKIGPTGITPRYLQDASFDYGTKQLYWFAYTTNFDDAGIYKVDTATGEAERITTYATGAKEFSGVFSMTPLFAADVPGLVTDVSVSVDPSTLLATVKFSMPVETYGGEWLSGSLNYDVRVDGQPGKTSSAPAGEVVEVSLPLERGSRRFTISVSNDAGDGPEYVSLVFAGFDQPAKVGDFTATRTADGIKLSWSPVTIGANGMPVDEADMSYIVTRLPEGVNVGTLSGTCEYVDGSSPAEAVKVSYEIVATDGVLSSVPAASNEVVAGEALTLPFSYDFRNKPGFGLFVSVDANGDGNSWMFRDKYGVLSMGGRTTSDDWLVTPPVKLTAGRKYKLTASMGVAMDKEKFEIKYGAGHHVEDMTESVIAPTEIDDIDYWYRDVWSEPGNFVEYIAPEESGEYHFGVHAISEPGGLFLYCHDIALEDAGASGIGDNVADEDGAFIGVEPGCIVVGGVDAAVFVYSVSGSLVAREKCEAGSSLRIGLDKGAYVVTVGGLAHKVLVY